MDYKLVIGILAIDALGSSVDFWINLKVSVILGLIIYFFFISCLIHRTVILILINFQFLVHENSKLQS